MNSVDLVVARYNEDTSWLNSVKSLNPDLRIFVYNKGAALAANDTWHYDELENVGNEAETYLWHMIYGLYLNDLARLTLFVQGRPFDHVHEHDLHHTIKHPEVVTDFKWLAFHHLDCKLENQCHHGGLPIAPFYKDLMGTDLRTNFHFGVGGQFAVSREIIEKAGLEHLQNARELVINQYKDNEPWCILERTWDQVLYVPNAGRYDS